MPDQELSDSPAPTGEPRVDAALTALDALDYLPVTDHPGVIEDAHQVLQEILAEEQE